MLLRLLDDRNRIRLIVSPEVGRDCAPTIFEGMERNGGHGKSVFARAIDRLLAADRNPVARVRWRTRRPRVWLDAVEKKRNRLFAGQPENVRSL